MSDISDIWVIATVVLIVMLLALMFFIMHLKNQNAILVDKNIALTQDATQFKDQNTQSQNVIITIREENTALKAELSSSQALYQALKEQSQSNLTTLKAEFELALQKQSNALLEQNKSLIQSDSKKILDEVFTPIQKSVEEYSKGLRDSKVSLETNIKNMFDYTQNMRKDADKLAQILKGDKKIRGNFAELQLKSVLEHSGLKQGEQYQLQEHFTIDGKKYIPDAVVHLDKQKSIIIDAKFSLPNDFDFAEITSIECDQIARNLKERIDELAKKPYANFKQSTYDYVLLFVPYNNLLDLALQANPSLYQYAYEKQIYLTTPHTLFMALKTIQISWLHIQGDENVKKALEEFGKFCDKFSSVLSSFNSIQKNLTALSNNIQTMQTQLDGRGGLSSFVERISALGAKSKKSLPKTNNSLLRVDNNDLPQDLQESSQARDS